MGAITRYHADVLQGRQAFIRGHEGLFLWNVAASEARPQKAAAAGQFLSFNTSFVNRADLENAGMREFAILPVLKRDDNAFSDRISLGRAPNCDMVLRLSYISKLHAHFTLRGGLWHLSDAGSANGTSVNGKQLRTGESMAVKVGDDVQFGSAEFRLTDAGLLYDVINPLLRG